MLNERQGEQVYGQIGEYEKLAGGPHKAEVPMGKQTFTLEVAPYVASPKVMNSGVHVVNFLAANPHVVQGKVVVDMGTGSGIIGIAAARLGAVKVYMADIDPAAVACAEKNALSNGVKDRCEIFTSDLFDRFPEDVRADVHIFNHPFFADEPLEGEEWTRMMLANPHLLKSYLCEVGHFAKPDAGYYFPWLELAANDGEEDNDPARHAATFGFQVLYRLPSTPVAMGLQKGEFVIYVLQKR